MDSNITKERYDPHGPYYIVPKRHPSRPYTWGKRHRDFLLGFLPSTLRKSDFSRNPNKKSRCRLPHVYGLKGCSFGSIETHPWGSYLSFVAFESMIYPQSYMRVLETASISEDISPRHDV
jgi:hypothetical protein